MPTSHARRMARLLAAAALCILWAATTQPSASVSRAQGHVVDITLHRGLVAGQTEPYGDVEIWRVDDDGTELGRWWDTANREGRFSTVLTNEGPRFEETIEPLEPGQTLLIDLAAGDPIRIQLPELTAATEIESDRLRGTAPAGARLELTVFGRSRGAVDLHRSELRGDAAGRWSAELDDVDLRRGDAGRLTLLRDDGHLIHLDWATVWLQLELQSGDLRLHGPSQRRFELALVDSKDQGHLRLAGRMPVSNLTSEPAVTLNTALRDLFGQRVLPSEGDRLVGHVGDEPVDLTVPAFDVMLDGEGNVVRGYAEAPAGTPVQLRLFDRHREGRWSVALDADRRFELPLATASPTWTLRAGQIAFADLQLQRADLHLRPTMPGLTLHLEGPRLDAQLAPGVAGTIEHRRDDVLLATHPVTGTGLPAATGLWPADGPWPIRAGDRLTLRPTDGGPPTGLNVPEMSLSLDDDAQHVEGCADVPDGARFELRGTLAELGEGPDLTSSVTWRQGCFKLDLTELRIGEDPSARMVHTLGPGGGARATVYLRSGNIVQLRRILPRLHAQLGTAQLCVEADPRTATEVTLSAAGELRAEGRTDARGRVQLTLRDAVGATSPVTGGQRLRLEAGGASDIVSLPPLHVQPDWPLRDLVLAGTPDARITVAGPATAVDCWHARPATRGWQSAVQLDEQGTAPVLVGEARDGVVVSHPSAGGHRAFMRLFPLRLEAHLGTDRVVGWTGQHHGVHIELRDSADRALAAGTAVADAEGRFALHLSGRDSALRPGRQLLATTPGDARQMTLPPLDFDWSAAGGLDGTTQPGTPVSVTLRLSDGRRLGLERQAGADGAFTLREADLPPGTRWSLADVAGVRTQVEVDGWHAAVREWPAAPAPTPVASLPPPSATPTQRSSATPSASATAAASATATRAVPPRPTITLRRELYVPWAGR